VNCRKPGGLQPVVLKATATQPLSPTQAIYTVLYANTQTATEIYKYDQLSQVKYWGNNIADSHCGGNNAGVISSLLKANVT